MAQKSSPMKNPFREVTRTSHPLFAKTIRHKAKERINKKARKCSFLLGDVSPVIPSYPNLHDSLSDRKGNLKKR